MFVFQLAGCSHGSAQGKIISYSLSTDPANLDPQVATDYNAILIIENIYEGLLSKASDGKLTEGVATDYTVSEDGLTYQFTLRQDSGWKHAYKEEKNEFNDTPVTANDFVFAFQRLLSPSTSSPHASKFYCIKNAQAVNTGQLGVDQLGVTAQGDYSLTIQLEYANSMFPELLTTSPAMPCNRDFFESTLGQYGLSGENILANGPFYLLSWAKDSYVRIRSNPYYASALPTVAGGVNLTVRASQDAYSALTEGDIDSGVLTHSQFDKINRSKFDITEFENSVWGLVFNISSSAASANTVEEPLFANREIRIGLAQAVQRESYSSSLPDDLATASAVIPPSVSVLDQSYRDLVGEEVGYAYNPEEARQHIQNGMAQTEGRDLNKAVVLVPASQRQLFERMAQIWQKELNIYLTATEIEDDKYEEALRKEKYDAAMMKFSSEANLPDSILAKFRSGSAYNTFGYQSDSYESILDSATLVTSLEECVARYKEAEQQLLSDAIFLPLYYQKEYFAVSKDVSDIIFDPSSKLMYYKYTQKK